MEILQFVPPQVSLQLEYRAMLEEWWETGEDLVPFTLKLDCNDFQGFILQLEEAKAGIGLQEGFVSHSTYWLIRKVAEQCQVLGAANIRHDLNKSLLKIGGHIGYGVRPSERGKGYATEILRRALLICKEEMNISKALITCHKDNIASAKVIVKNGGVLEKETTYNGKTVQHYWISDF